MIFTLILVSAIAYAACPAVYDEGMIVCEDFEDVQGFTDGIRNFVVASHATGEAYMENLTDIAFARTFHCGCDENGVCYPHPNDSMAYQGGIIETGGNPGQCARAKILPYVGVSYSEPKIRFDDALNGSREVYVSFDLKVDENLGTSNLTREIYNFKMILITDHTDASSGAHSDGIGRIQINFGPSSDSYSVYSPGAGDTSLGDTHEYYFSHATTKLMNHVMDNRWHTYEIYIDIGEHISDPTLDPGYPEDWHLHYDPDNDGVIMIWEDGTLILNDTQVPMRGSDFFTELNSVAYIRHAKSQGAPVEPVGGNLYFDNVDVWDQMPAVQNITSAHIRSNVRTWKQGQITLSELMDLIRQWKV